MSLEEEDKLYFIENRWKLSEMEDFEIYRLSEISRCPVTFGRVLYMRAEIGLTAPRTMIGGRCCI